MIGWGRKGKGKMKVLIVDDEVLNHRAIARALRLCFTSDVEILFAFSGLGAITALKEHIDVDFVVLDYEMSVLDGLQTLPTMVSLQQNVFMYTAKADKIRDEAMEIGAKGVFAKPNELSELMQAAKEVGS